MWIPDRFLLGLKGDLVLFCTFSVSTSMALKAVHIDCWVERPCWEAQEREGIAVLRSQCKVRCLTFSVDHKRNQRLIGSRNGASATLEYGISGIDDNIYISSALACYLCLSEALLYTLYMFIPIRSSWCLFCEKFPCFAGTCSRCHFTTLIETWGTPESLQKEKPQIAKYVRSMLQTCVEEYIYIYYWHLKFDFHKHHEDMQD